METSTLVRLCAFFAVAGMAVAQTVPVAQHRSASPSHSAISHVLAPNELIEVKVFQEPDLDVSTRIPDDGKITVPLIGEVAVAGKNVQQASGLIRDLLAARFLVNPQVTLTVLEEAKRLFTILGQVQRPGTYRFPERQTLDLVQVIGIAGGYTRLADASRITIKRHRAGKETVFKVDGKRLAREVQAEPFSIVAGDVITVGERLF